MKCFTFIVMKTVPLTLRKWFIVHFIVDMLFAIPLMIAPVFILELIGWMEIDPMMTRIVAAALFGIGIESWIGRNAGIESFRGMLNLKILWSGAVIMGVILSLFEVSPLHVSVWGILIIFSLFHLLWWYWRMVLR